jgi:tellurite resistance protein TerB
MFGRIKAGLSEVTSGLAAAASRFKNRSFMEAVVAACAMVSAADGSISSEEKAKMMGFLQNSAELKHFETAEVIAFFDKVTASFDFDLAIGKAEALKTIGKLRGKEDQARLMIRVACAIGASDGNFDASEKAVIREICRDLGLDPADFDL